MEFLSEAERFNSGVVPHDLVLGALATAEALFEIKEEESDE